MDISLRDPEILSKSKPDNRFFFGSIRKTKLDFIPVLFDIKDVDRVAKRYRDLIITQLGTIDSSVMGHAYPVLGTVALGFQLDNPTTVNIDIGDKDYGKLNIKDVDMAIYNKDVDKTMRQRGVVYKQAFNKLKLVSAKYYANIDVKQPVGFSILNCHPKITKSDIEFLKRLYNDKEKIVDLTQLGGVDYKVLYMKEKKKYLDLKKSLYKE
jgi:hypothetical protein